MPELTTKRLIDYLNTPGVDAALLKEALIGTGLASEEQGAEADTALQPDDVGGAAFEEVSEFASAAQGSRADSALQSAQNLTDLSDKPTARFNMAVPSHVVDRTALAALDPTKELSAVLREDTQKGLFFPKLISALSAAALAAMAVDLTHQIYMPSDDPDYAWIRQGAELRGFYSNSATPAYVHRLRERIMIGESAGFDASTAPDTNTGASWLHTLKSGAAHSMGYLETHGRVVSTGSNGAQFVGATRITGAAPVEGYGGIFHVRNESTNNTKTWGLYIDAVRGNSAAGHVAGIEIDVGNCAGSADVSMLPYGLVGGESANGWTYGINIASGADITVNPDALAASHALGIINNGSRFNSGIVFRSDSLVVDGGGLGRAITLAQQHKIGWYGSTDGLEASFFTSTVTQAATGTKGRFVGSGFELLRYADDKPYFRALYNSSAVNCIEIVATATGTSPIIRAYSGGDTNQNIVIQPAGTGKLQVTTAVTTSTTNTVTHKVPVRWGGVDLYLLASTSST